MLPLRPAATQPTERNPHSMTRGLKPTLRQRLGAVAEMTSAPLPLALDWPRLAPDPHEEREQRSNEIRMTDSGAGYALRAAVCVAK